MSKRLKVKCATALEARRILKWIYTMDVVPDESKPFLSIIKLPGSKWWYAQNHHEWRGVPKLPVGTEVYQPYRGIIDISIGRWLKTGNGWITNVENIKQWKTNNAR